jgi:hypothetical protein
VTANVELTVVVASEDGRENLPEIIDALAPQSHTRLEVILAAADQAEIAAAERLADQNVRIVRARPGSRIPDLWRDGIMAANGSRVALLSSHCVPRRDWIATALQRDFPANLAAVGGYFENASDANATACAIFLLRYAEYSRPSAEHDVAHVAADNAIYRRDAIMACADLLPLGFWEPEYHRRFAQAGLRLVLDPNLIVVHRNRYSYGAFAAQRREHGFHFGRDRALKLSTARKLGYLVATPLVPVLLYAKVISRAIRKGWLMRLPFSTYFMLAILVGHWSYGEARGVWHAMRDKQ